MRRQFVSRSKFETLSARCCCNVIDGNDRNRFHHSRQLKRSVEPRRQGPCTKAIVARFRTIRSYRSLFSFCFTTAVMLATANLSRSIAHVRTTRPTHRWASQHGEAHQQVDKTSEHQNQEAREEENQVRNCRHRTCESQCQLLQE